MGEAAKRGPDPDDGLAKVIQLHPQVRSCFTCMNSRSVDVDDSPVTWCTIYEEIIDSELYAAEDCFTYERCNEGDQPVEEITGVR